MAYCSRLPDAVAAAATGGASRRRKLYTNAETVTLRARAWISLTSVNPTFGSDAGIADRILRIRMGRVGGDSSDVDLLNQIHDNRDAALSHVCQTSRTALADRLPVPGGLNHRHPDFATFAVRIGRALGRNSDPPRHGEGVAGASPLPVTDRKRTIFGAKCQIAVADGQNGGPISNVTNTQ
jgi:hypothetical protein